MEARDIRFAWADAWVLASVAVGGGLRGCGLREILAASDLINRAMLSGPELRSGLGKLLAAGLVRRQGREGFVVAGTARDAVERFLDHPSPAFSVMHLCERMLAVDPYRPADAAGDEAAWDLGEITDARVAEASGAYREQMAALWNELRRIDRQGLPDKLTRLFETTRRTR